MFSDTVANVTLCISALAGFVYSLIKVFGHRKSLYLKMVGCALGCLFLERLSTMVEIIVSSEMPDLFHVSTFGNIGYSMFMFSANYGTINSLTDDGSGALSKITVCYRGNYNTYFAGEYLGQHSMCDRSIVYGSYSIL